MSEEYELTIEGFKARIGADRMAMGLPSTPHKERGDMDAVALLSKQRDRAVAACMAVLNWHINGGHIVDHVRACDDVVAEALGSGCKISNNSEGKP